MGELRAPIKLAVNAFKCDPLMSMGDCMELFALATTAEEAALLRDAYITSLVLDTKLTREAAEDRTDKNLRFGISYMGKDEIHALYFPPQAHSPQEDTMKGIDLSSTQEKT